MRLACVTDVVKFASTAEHGALLPSSVKRKESELTPPPCDESGGAHSDSLAEDLGRIMEEDHFVSG